MCPVKLYIFNLDYKEKAWMIPEPPANSKYWSNTLATAKLCNPSLALILKSKWYDGLNQPTMFPVLLPVIKCVGLSVIETIADSDSCPPESALNLYYLTLSSISIILSYFDLRIALFASSYNYYTS